MSQLFTSDGKSIGTSASVLPGLNQPYSGLISFSIDWFDRLAAQWTQQETFIKIKFPI